MYTFLSLFLSLSLCCFSSVHSLLLFVTFPIFWLSDWLNSGLVPYCGWSLWHKLGHWNGLLLVRLLLTHTHTHSLSLSLTHSYIVFWKTSIITWHVSLFVGLSLSFNLWSLILHHWRSLCVFLSFPRLMIYPMLVNKLALLLKMYSCACLFVCLFVCFCLKGVKKSSLSSLQLFVFQRVDAPLSESKL
jgi:hypothetical protein